MYDFMFNDYKGPDPWPVFGVTAADKAKRTSAFSHDDLKAILRLWAHLAADQPKHDANKLTIPLAGCNVTIQPGRIRFDAQPNAEQMRATMAHIEDRWGGKAIIPLNADREFRLKARAYAEVFGVRLDDTNEAFREKALTKAELAKLPQLRADIRKAHPDAPPVRPNEEKTLAAMYAARYPHRVPEPA